MFSQTIRELVQSEDIKSFTADITVDTSPDKQFLVDLGQGTSIPLIAVFAPGKEEPFILQGAYTQQDIIDLIEQARTYGR
ncbi:MAG: hypothetical protein AAGA29_09270 [Planctomycetota bacterium]